MPTIRVTLFPAGKGKPEVIEWEHTGGRDDVLLRDAKILAGQISKKGITTGCNTARTTFYPVSRIEKVEVLE